MASQRQVDIYGAGCALCDAAVKRVREMAGPSCTITVMDMKDPAIAARAAGLGIRAVPAVVIDGKLADCCSAGGPDESALRAAGVGSPLSRAPDVIEKDGRHER